MQASANEHGNEFVFYTAVEPDSLITILPQKPSFINWRSEKSAENPRSRNLAQRLCEKRNRCRVNRPSPQPRMMEVATACLAVSPPLGLARSSSPHPSPPHSGSHPGGAGGGSPGGKVSSAKQSAAVT